MRDRYYLQKDFEKEKMDEFDIKFPELFSFRYLEDSYTTCEKEIKSFLLTSLRQSYTLGQEEERKAWLNGKRCEHCGESKKRDPLWKMCDMCVKDL